MLQETIEHWPVQCWWFSLVRCLASMASCTTFQIRLRGHHDRCHSGNLVHRQIWRRTWGMNLAEYIIGLLFVGAGYQFDPQLNLTAAECVGPTRITIYMLFIGSYAFLISVIQSESPDLRTRPFRMPFYSIMLFLWSFIVTYDLTRMNRAFTYTGLAHGFYSAIAFVELIYQVISMPGPRTRQWNRSTTASEDHLGALQRKTGTGANQAKCDEKDIENATSV